MKKIICTCLLFILALSLVSCSYVDLTTSDKIGPPNENIIINGEWKVKEYKIALNQIMDENIASKYIDEKAVFNRENAEILGEQCVSPKYKIKNENALEYFYYNYKINPETIGIKQKSIQVITISSNKNFFDDVVRLDDNTLIIHREGCYLFLKNQYSKTVNNHKKENKLTQQKKKNNNSGILLVLKSYEESNVKNKEKFKYRTIWVSSEGNIKSIEEIPVALVPRKNGFWLLDVKRNDSYDYLFAYPIINKENKPIIQKPNDSYNRNIDIKFIGNDFISIESTQEDEKGEQLLKVLPIDILYGGQEKSIKISEIMGVKGTEALNLGANALINTFNDNNKKKINPIPDETSFSILRDSGRWVVKGRLNNSMYTSNDYYIDFDIPIIPPKAIVAHDALYPSWNIIKQKVPLAIDAYSSPNKDLAIVLTKDKLLVYGVKENQLNNNPEAQIALKNNETSIMAQWAMGEYVKTWREQVKELKK